MATNTAGSKAREHHENMVHYHAKTVTYSNANTTVTLGIIPAGAVVIEAGVVVTTAFNGSSPVVDIGTSDDSDAFGTDLDLSTAGRIIDTAINANNDFSASADVTVVAALNDSSASAGSGVVYVMYLIPGR